MNKACGFGRSCSGSGVHLDGFPESKLISHLSRFGENEEDLLGYFTVFCDIWQWLQNEACELGKFCAMLWYSYLYGTIFVIVWTSTLL